MSGGYSKHVLWRFHTQIRKKRILLFIDLFYYRKGPVLLLLKELLNGIAFNMYMLLFPFTYMVTCLVLFPIMIIWSTAHYLPNLLWPKLLFT